MIDLHCHILHGIDDGPRSLAESLQMARCYSANGYKTIAATPHMIPGTGWMPSTDLINRKIAALNREVGESDIEIEIISGMEIALDAKIPDLLDEGRLMCLGDSSCLLIEPPFQQLPFGWERVVFTIQAKGYSILLAHPERCEQLTWQPRTLELLRESAVYLQVSYGSLMGRYGRRVARNARMLVETGQVHCLATDGHCSADLDPRDMQAANEELRKLIGPSNLRLIAFENPSRVLRGEVLERIEKSEVVGRVGKPRRWLFWKHDYRKRELPVSLTK